MEDVARAAQEGGGGVPWPQRFWRGVPGPCLAGDRSVLPRHGGGRSGNATVFYTLKSGNGVLADQRQLPRATLCQIEHLVPELRRGFEGGGQPNNCH